MRIQLVLFTFVALCIVTFNNVDCQVRNKAVSFVFLHIKIKSWTRQCFFSQFILINIFMYVFIGTITITIAGRKGAAIIGHEC